MKSESEAEAMSDMDCVSKTIDRKIPRVLVAGLAFLFAACYGVVPALGQTTIPVTPKPVVNGAVTLVGPSNQNQTLHLVIGLKHPNWAAEQQFLQDLQTVSKGQYHQFLTADEYNAKFAPSAQDEQAVVNWATSQGLTVTNRFPNRLLVDVEGTVATIQSALNVSINNYQLGSSTGFSNDRDPQVPANLSGIVQSIAGLQNLQVLHPLNKKIQEPAFPVWASGPSISAGASTNGSGDSSKLPQANSLGSNYTSGAPYDPQDLYSTAAYDAYALYNLGHCCNPTNNSGGSPPETSIAIATAGAQNFGDIVGFHNNFPYIAWNITEFGIDGQAVPCSDSTDGTCDGEGTLDMQWSTAMANSFGAYQNTAHVYMYDGVNPGFGTFEDIYNHMLSDSLARNFSTSWGCQETACYDNADMTTTDGLFSAMVAQGWSLTAAAGDHGATASCTNSISVEFPASDPFVVGAGGTTMYLFGGPPPSFSSFSAWSGGPDGCALGDPVVNDGGTGGGYSAFFGIPSYQSGLPSRGVPDIALDADWYNTPTYMYFAGGLNGNGGTSIVAPETVGFFAQENAYLLYLGNICGSGSSPCAPMGAVNPYLYAEGYDHGAPHNPYYDVTTGCNNNDVTAFYGIGYYCAGAGWDPVTGWGQYNFLQLAWAINWYHIPGYTSPAVTFSGPAVNHWYNSDQIVSWTIAANPAIPSYPSSGLAGFTQAWDSDPGNEANVKATPGLSGFPGVPYDAFYDGPQYANASSGCLDFTGASCLGSVGQGMHTVNVRAWGNEGERSADATYGPIGYDTVPPVTTATLSGTLSGGVYISPVKVTLTATDPGAPSTGSGVASTVYQIDGGAVTTYSSPFTVSALGSHTVTFHSTDVAGNIESTKSVTFAIHDTTATSLVSSLNPSTYGTAVTFTATVTSSGGTPTGTVTFKDGATTLGTGTLSGGIAKLTTSTVPGGSNSITAVYGGSSDFSGSTSPALTQTVNKAGTTTTVSSSGNPSAFGHSVTFTAKVTSATSGTPSGTITFKDGATTLGTGTLNASGVATLATAALSVGTHSITAAYSGSGDFNASTSAALTQTVDKANTTTTVSSSANPSAYGHSVTFTAKVTPATSGTPSGTITFKDGATTLGTGTLNASGVATLAIASLSVGTHSITAAYAGNADFNASTSASLTQTVDKANTTTTVTSSKNPSSFNQSVTFTAKVVSGTVPAAGSVTFKDGATVLGTGTLNASGETTLAIASLALGAHSITAAYAGNADFNASTSAALTQTVGKAATTAAVASSLNPSVNGQSVTFTATITPAFGGSPTGTVTFKNGATVLGSSALNTTTHKATFATSTLATGTHSITADYAGDTNFDASASPALTQTVNP